jgi:hypothetical protein
MRLSRLFRRGPAADRTSIGRLLVDNGLITDADLKRATAVQDERKARDNDVKLGEILVELGVVEHHIVEAVLLVQDARRRMDVDEVVNVVCRQSAQVIELQDHFINGDAVKVKS